jgi:Protein of unknown function (DUF3606)
MGIARRDDMGSIHPPKKQDYGNNTRIDLNQSYQLAYWKDRFDISEEELREAVRAAGGLVRNVEAYLRQKHVER